MDAQLLSLIVAVAIGFVAFLVIRFILRIVHFGLNLAMLAVVALVVYFLLRDKIAALVGK